MAVGSSDLNIVVKLVDQASKELQTLSKNFDKTWESIQTQTQAAQSFTKVMAWTALVVWGYATKQFMDFEKTMSWVKAVLSPTWEEFDALGEKAKQLGKDTTFSQGEVAKGIEELAKNGLTATQILNWAADATTYLAAAAGTDLTTAATISSDAMSIFWIKAEDMKTAINWITWVAVASKFGVDDYALALAQGWWVAKAVWVSFEDFNASIAAISPLFASGSDAWTSFKTFLQRLVPASKEAATLMDDLGVSFFDASWNMKSMEEIAWILQNSMKGLSDEQKNTALTTMFGTDAMRAAAAMAEAGAEGFKKVQDQIRKTDAMKQAEIRLDNLSGAWEKFTGSVSVIAVDLGAKIWAYLEPLLINLTNFIDNFWTKWDELDPIIQNIIIWVWGITAWIIALTIAVWALGLILGPIISGFSMIASVFSVLISIWGSIISWLGAVVAFLGGPLTLAILAIIAVWTLLYQAWTNNWRGIQEIVKGAVDSVVWFMTSLGAKMAEIWWSITTAASNAWQTITDAFSVAWNGIVSVVTTIGQILFATILVLLDSILQLFGTNLASVIQAAMTGWQTLTSITSIAFEGIKNFIFWFWEGIKAIFTAAINFIKPIFSAFWDWLKNAASIAWNAIKGAVGELWDGITGLFKVWAALASSIWSPFADGLVNVMSAAWGNIKNTISSGINWIIDKANAIIASINAVTAASGFTISSIQRVAFEKGGIVPGHYQTGGIIPGGKNPANHDQIPAMLDPGELILNRAQQANIAGQLSWESKQQTIIQVNINWNSFYWDDESFVEKIGNTLVEKFQTHYSLQAF